MVGEIAITQFVESDHTCDNITMKSVTGILNFFGRTLVLSISNRQEEIDTSTQGAEFYAMKMAAEEVIAIHYMLRCLGVKVMHKSLLFGDNKGVVQNATVNG